MQNALAIRAGRVCSGSAGWCAYWGGGFDMVIATLRVLALPTLFVARLAIAITERSAFRAVHGLMMGMEFFYCNRWKKGNHDFDWVLNRFDEKAFDGSIRGGLWRRLSFF
jgi:hypothetical protein